MKFEQLRNAIKLKEKEFDKPRTDMLTGQNLNSVDEQEQDEQTEAIIQQLKNKKKIAEFHNPDNPGKFLQAEKKKKNKAFIKEMEENPDVMGMVQEICKTENKALENKLAKAAKAEELATLFTAHDVNFQPLMQSYCCKTGRYLHNVDLAQLQRVVNILGRERGLEVLRLNAVQNTSLEWLHTEPETLNKLMINDCTGYFVYCTSLMFQTEYTIASNAGTSAPNVSNKNFDELDSLLNSLPDFGTQAGTTEELNFHALPVKDQTRYNNLMDKVSARENLELLNDNVLVMQANELMRRLLGLASASNIAKMGIFQSVTLEGITDSRLALIGFIAELQATLKTVFIQFFRGMHYTKAEFVIDRLRTRTITAQNIAAIKAEFKGRSNFHKQPKIKNLTDKQKQEAAILNDLMNFWDEQIETGSNVDEAMEQTDELLGCVFDLEEKPKNRQTDSTSSEAKPLNIKTVKLGDKNLEAQPHIAEQFKHNSSEILKQIKKAEKPKSFKLDVKKNVGFKLKLNKE